MALLSISRDHIVIMSSHTNKNSLLRIYVSDCFYLASPVGIEPTTNGLKVRCSTS